ncbi:MAG: hypothetical protein WEC00_00510 [Dongiaceae bacterium]
MALQLEALDVPRRQVTHVRVQHEVEMDLENAGRVGILLMAEALFGSFTAALFSDEPFGLRQITGGLLILGAATVDTLVVRSEIAPDRRNAFNRRPDSDRAGFNAEGGTT